MEKLVSTSEAAQMLGLSVQGIHYRIKNNKLKSIKKDGKIFVYLDENKIEVKNVNNQKSYLKKNNKEEKYIDLVIKLKDEQIFYLKTFIKEYKEQHKKEILRLEKNQKKIINVFKSEIELLQSAFNEMRLIYRSNNIKQKVNKIKKKNTYISLKDFFVYMKKNGKNDKEIKNIILMCLKKNDKRFIYNNKNKKIIIRNDDFSDLF